jgi:hypothetical protein
VIYFARMRWTRFISYPEARCIRHRGDDGLTHFSVYSDDAFEPDVAFLGTGWTEQMAWKDAARREFPQYAREDRS